ncbi:unnamed protein product [Closterium sp. Yama58-4]|nr:unnamed protein product [Closterium sp. Yama58-4]
MGEEIIRSRLEQVSAFLANGYGEGSVKDNIYLSRILVQYPRILLNPPERIASIVSLLQSFTPPGSPSVAVPVLRHAPTLMCHSSQNILSKLQYLEKLVGRKAAGSVVRSYSSILVLSVENMQGKVELLSDLIGRENAVLAVARFPRLLSSNGENLKKGFRELVREVEAAMEESGGEEVRRQMLEEGARKLAREGSRQAFKSIAGATIAHEMVANLVVKFPHSICYSWERNTKHKVEYLKQDIGLPVTEVLAFPYFLGYSLDQRIRPRHLALLSKGYVLVPHEVARPKNGGGGGNMEGVSNERRAEGKDEDIKVDYGEDEVEMHELGVRKVEHQSVLGSMQDYYGVLGRTGAANRCGMNQQQGREAVCLAQLLKCSDKEFEKRFGVELAPFMLETRP